MEALWAIGGNFGVLRARCFQGGPESLHGEPRKEIGQTSKQNGLLKSPLVGHPKIVWQVALLSVVLLRSRTAAAREDDGLPASTRATVWARVHRS